jgi:outer membrane protein assembly factor BamB
MMNRGTVCAVRGTFATLAVLAALVASVTSAVASAATPATTSAAATHYTWPKYAQDNADNGVSADPAITSANAGQLGVKWMAPNQTDMESSPVVQYSSSLGEDVVYSANQSGGLTAYNAKTGAVVWTRNLGSPIISTPIVADNAVYVTRMYAPEMFKLSASTGSTLCHSAPLLGWDETTATMGTPPGGVQSVYIGVDGVPGSQVQGNGPEYALNASNCSEEWSTYKYNSNAGTWDPDSFAVDAKGEGLVIMGTDNADSSMYAFDANTGVKVWSFQGLNPANGDVGTGASVTAPGVNGFADGVAYISNNGGYTYALDLTTGALIWKFNWASLTGGTLSGPPRGTAAVAGNMVVVPGPTGVVGLNATTGAQVWSWTGPQPSDSAAAVTGPPGQQVVAVTDLSGNLDVLNVQTGKLLYQFNTGGFAVTSVAEADGNLYVASGSGFLYDFGLQGANKPAPTGAVTSPAPGSQLPNPNGNLNITGTATAAAGATISKVGVAVQEGGSSGDWWDPATDQWTPGFDYGLATLASPGAASTTWTFPLPIPAGGGTYQVQVSAVEGNGQADISGYSSAPGPAHESFSVNYSASAPHLGVSGSTWVAPGTSVGVTGSGFSAGESVAISLAGTTLVTAKANPSGGFTKSVPIPATAAFGSSSLVATGGTSGNSTTAAIDVSNQWTQVSYNSLHGGAEPNDQTWFTHFVGSHGQYITQAWDYDSGASVDAQPAVVDDVAYFGNTSGTVTALNVRNSTPLWTYSAGSGVVATPAVDSGLVFFGTAAGSVDALSAASGSVAWTVPTTSAVRSAPAAASGEVFVGSQNGTVYAINEATGAVSWRATLGGAVRGSPAVDPSTNEVIVGDAGGAVTALSMTTGAVLWSTNTDGAVTATASITNNGLVLVGSANDKVYELNETTGAMVWTYTTKAAVTSRGSLYIDNRSAVAGAYFVGDSSGNVYFIDIVTGALIRMIPGTGSAVTGTSAPYSFAIVSYANGYVFADKFDDELTWTYQGTASEAPATTLNGVVYLAGEDGAVRAFTVPGTQIP